MSGEGNEGSQLTTDNSCRPIESPDNGKLAKEEFGIRDDRVCGMVGSERARSGRLYSGSADSGESSGIRVSLHAASCFFDSGCLTSVNSDLSYGNE